MKSSFLLSLLCLALGGQFAASAAVKQNKNTPVNTLGAIVQRANDRKIIAPSKPKPVLQMPPKKVPGRIPATKLSAIKFKHHLYHSTHDKQSKHHKKSCKRMTITQRDLDCNNGFTISKPGVWYVECPLKWSQKNPAITIKADHVTLDFQNNTLDLQGSGHIGVKVTSKNVEICNGHIKNTAIPEPIFVPGNTFPASIFDASIATPPQLVIDNWGLPYEFATVDPQTLNFVGIGIQLAEGAEEVTIEDTETSSCYIGIGGTARLSNITLRNCSGFNCGTDTLTQDPVFNCAINTPVMRYRGGFFILQDQNPTVINDRFNFNDSNLPADKISHGITILNCLTDGPESSAGIVLWRAGDVTIENCTAGTNGNNPSDFVECRPIAVFLSQDIVVKNCNVFRGNSGFQFLGSRRTTIEDCVAENCSDQGFDLDTTRDLVARRLVVTGASTQPGQFLVPGTGLKAVGISVFFSDSVLVEDSIVNGCLHGNATGIGFFKSNNSTFKGCTVYNNIIGALMISGNNLSILDCYAYSNKIAGFMNGNTPDWGPAVGGIPFLWNIPVITAGTPCDPNPTITVLPGLLTVTGVINPTGEYGINKIFRGNKALGNGSGGVYNGITPIGNYSSTIPFVVDLDTRLTADLPVEGYNLVLD